MTKNVLEYGRVHVYNIETCLTVLYTGEPGEPIKDPTSRGHNSLSTKDTLQGPRCSFSQMLIHFEPLKSVQPIFKRQNGWPHGISFGSTVPLYTMLSW